MGSLIFGRADLENLIQTLKTSKKLSKVVCFITRSICKTKSSPILTITNDEQTYNFYQVFLAAINVI